MQKEIEKLKGRRMLRRSQERGREEKVRELEEAVRELGRMVQERVQVEGISQKELAQVVVKRDKSASAIKQQASDIEMARQIAEVNAQIEAEKRRRQMLLQDQVLKENKLRKLRGRVSELDNDRYPEVLHKLEKE